MLRREWLVIFIAVGLVCCGGESKQQPGGEDPECGNDVRYAEEACDGTDLVGETCTTAGYDAGTLGCTSTCTYDFAACTGTGPVCDGAAVTGFEQCDGTRFDGANCGNLAYDGGTLACNADCTFDVSACTGTGPTCGNDIQEGRLEECDGTDLATNDCTDMAGPDGSNFDKGTLACDPGCRFTTGDCKYFECGDNEVDPGETCDGTDLDGRDVCTHGDFEYTAGSGGPRCMATCEEYDLSACGAHTQCGDNGLDAGAGEQCDIRNGTVQYDQNDCQALGFSGGTLACNTTNCTYNVSGCTL